MIHAVIENQLLHAIALQIITCLNQTVKSQRNIPPKSLYFIIFGGQ